MSTRVSACAALLVALAAVFGTAMGLSALRSQERAASAAEKRLITLRLEVVQMLDIPWGASPAETNDPQRVRDELLGAEEAVVDEIDSLALTPGLPERSRFLAQFQPAVEALEQTLQSVASEDDDGLGGAPEISARHIYEADAVMQLAADRYRREAERAAAQEAIGSVALIGSLFVAFAVYFARAARDRNQRARAAADLAAARDAALEGSRAKSMFVANMSHEIRTPLTTVLATVEILEDSDLDEVQRRLVHKMGRAGVQLKGLVEEVLDFSRIEAGRVTLASEPFDLHTMVVELADGYASRAHHTGFRFEWSLGPDVPRTVVGDQIRLAQVLSNLLDNAFKFTHQGRVTLTAQRANDEAADLTRDRAVDFVVEDTGIGIPKEQLPSLFEAFHQVDGSITRHYSGSGLGLAILKELTVLMHGSVTVTSRPGAGSVFRVRIPVRQPPAPAGTEALGHTPIRSINGHPRAEVPCPGGAVEA